MTPTDEQVSIINYVRSEAGNFAINALAGTGKSTTLRMVNEATAANPVLYLVFNKDAAKAAEGKFPDTTVIRTLNSLGHRVWAQTVGKVTLDTKKSSDLLRSAIDELTGQDKREAREAYFEVLTGVALAKAVGYIPEGKFEHARRLISREDFHRRLEEEPSEITADLIDTVLLGSIKASYKGLIDFNDQIYMPALFGGSFPRFPLVLVDEAQDLNPCNHAMLEKLCRNRIGIVGDPYQSIYAFRGAVQSGMCRLKSHFSMSESTISISFRCPRAIVEAARWRVPNYRWMKDGGQYEVLPDLRANDIPEGAAIICRNNAPLFRVALQMLGLKRSVSVAGSEIGPKIVRLLGKIGAPEDTSEDLIFKIEAWKQEKLTTSQAPGTVCDTAECMKVFATFGKTLSAAVAYAEYLFKQQGTIQLLTGHKAKGREWDTVYFLDPWLIGRDDEQEDNLRYVIQTRSKDRCFEINSKDIKWH